MRDRSRAFAPSRIVRACALAFLAVLAAAPNAAARESGFQSEGAYALVSKDINGARWAMTYDTQSEVITGNVVRDDVDVAVRSHRAERTLAGAEQRSA
jgi:pyrroline-5-carboxylate reductase